MQCTVRVVVARSGPSFGTATIAVVAISVAELAIILLGQGLCTKPYHNPASVL